MTEFLKVEMRTLEGFIRGEVFVGEVGGSFKSAGALVLSSNGWNMLQASINLGMGGKRSVEMRSEETIG